MRKGVLRKGGFFPYPLFDNLEQKKEDQLGFHYKFLSSDDMTQAMASSMSASDLTKLDDENLSQAGVSYGDTIAEMAITKMDSFPVDIEQEDGTLNEVTIDSIKQFRSTPGLENAYNKFKNFMQHAEAYDEKK